MELEDRVLEVRRKTGYGRKWLAWYLAREEGLELEVAPKFWTGG